MLASEKVPRVPEEYQEVAWLRGSGTQWCYLPRGYSIGLDSDNHFHGIKGDIELLTSTQYTKFVIIAESGNPNQIGYTYWRIRVNYGTLTELYHPQDGYQQSDISHSASGSLIYHFEINKNSMVINDSILAYPYIPTGSYYNDYISIGRMSGTIENNNVLIKGIQLTYDDNVILELIPCYRKSDNKAGLFYWIDYSQGTSGFITNSGSGSDFLIGPDV